MLREVLDEKGWLLDIAAQPPLDEWKVTGSFEFKRLKC
jgi:hypothetical protein